MNIEFFGDEGNIGVIKILKNSLMNVSWNQKLLKSHVLDSETNLHVSQKADVHELRELQVRRRLNPSVSKKENEWLVIECVDY